MIPAHDPPEFVVEIEPREVMLSKSGFVRLSVIEHAPSSEMEEWVADHCTGEYRTAVRPKSGGDRTAIIFSTLADATMFKLHWG